MGILEIFRGECARMKNVNVAVAAYVTNQARLKLYEYLRVLGEFLLYCNTVTDKLGEFGSDPTPMSLCRGSQKCTHFLYFDV